MRPRKLTAARIAAEIEPCHGILNRIARKLGVSRRAVYDVMMADEQLQLTLFQARESRLDDAETILDAALEAGERWAVLEVLHSTAGRRRGWGGGDAEQEEHIKALEEALALIEGKGNGIDYRSG